MRLAVSSNCSRFTDDVQSKVVCCYCVDYDQSVSIQSVAFWWSIVLVSGY